MKHGVKLKKIGKTHSHRKALIKNMLKSFIQHEKMITTVEKAKAFRPFIEKMITRAKVDSTPNRRIVFSRLESKSGVDKLFEDIAKRYLKRDGGYTRILKLYNRKGDNASMALIELVEEELPNKKKAAVSKKTSESTTVAKTTTTKKPLAVKEEDISTTTIEENTVSEAAFVEEEKKDEQ